MKITFVSSKPSSGSAVVIAHSATKLSDAATAFDTASKGQIKRALKATDFKGKFGQSATVLSPAGVDTKRVMVTGVSNPMDTEMLGAKAAKAFLMSGETTLTLHLDGLDLTPTDAARAALGARLAAYRFNTYKTQLKDSQKPSLKTVRIAYDNPSAAKKAYDNYFGPVGDGTLFARDLVNEPPNVIYPKNYAARIKKTLEPLGVKIEILGEKRMKTLGMEALLGVGRGSERESQLVIMRWNGGKQGAKPVCLVGKGVTFDSGGISLKPGPGMGDMKGDMGGSAAVVGAMLTLAKRKAKSNVIGVVGLVENMPDGRAQNPGDIVKSMSGQTIEILNTDAEGRLVLADALHYTHTKYKPKAMVNLATLTGAIMISLGHEHGGCFSNDDNLAAQLLSAGETTTEKLWRMPLGDAYDQLIDTPNADMKNIGGRAAGSITAGQFLQRFVGKTTWAHLDIAGMAFKQSRKDPREPSWATGYGARLLNRWVSDNHEG